MSLHYIIDGYNIINHIKFKPTRKEAQDPRGALLEFIKVNRLTGSPKNKITLIFDGYPDLSKERPCEANISIVFSKGETADALINRMVEASSNPRNIAVVSDDNEIRLFVKSLGAHPVGVEEFINPGEKTRDKREDLVKPELNYSQISRINKELKGIWLK